MKLNEYLRCADECLDRQWLSRLRERAMAGDRRFLDLEPADRSRVMDLFKDKVRTEELKAWYSAPEADTLFQGTSISSLTVPAVFREPLGLQRIEDLEEAIAEAYITYHRKYVEIVRAAIVDDVESWLREGLYYGIVIASKVLSQAFGLCVDAAEVITTINGVQVDPHEIGSYSRDVREAYFSRTLRRMECFDGVDLTEAELESSLILGDISKPALSHLRSKILLAPVRCNEIAAALARRVRARIIDKTAGRIAPPSLAVVIYDTDTPYTYHKLATGAGRSCAPVLPGLTPLGASGTLEAFRWLYVYRASLIAQKIQKSSLYSEVHKCYVPFVFFGVLVPRDAEILLDMAHLDTLRYRGNLSSEIEFAWTVPDLLAYLDPEGGRQVPFEDLLSQRGIR